MFSYTLGRSRLYTAGILCFSPWRVDCNIDYAELLQNLTNISLRIIIKIVILKIEIGRHGKRAVVRIFSLSGRFDLLQNSI
jgi:hypothetical protein